MGLCSLDSHADAVFSSYLKPTLPSNSHKARGGKRHQSVRPWHAALGPEGASLLCPPAGWNLLEGSLWTEVTDKMTDGLREGKKVTWTLPGPRRPTSQPKNHLFQEASQLCSRPTAQHP